MHTIHKKIVTDERKHPVAVLIDYKDWLEIEKILASESKISKKGKLSKYAGTLELKEDPLEYQKKSRDEWK